MVGFFGDYDLSEIVYIPFNTFSSDDPSASVTVTDLVAADVEIHKDGGTTQRASDNGVTVTINFDSVTGNHLIAIDLSDNSDAGFYSAGSRYQVRIEGATVDGGTINAWIGAFSIGCTLRPATDGRTLVVDSNGRVDVSLIEGSDATDQINAACDTALTDYDGPTHTELVNEINDVQSDIAGLNDPDVASIADAVWDEALAGHDGAGSAGEAQNRLDDIQADTEDLQTQVGADGAGLTNIPWNSLWDAEVQSECADALAAYNPPTEAEMNARTLPAADYFDPTADQVTVGTNTDKSGYALSSGGIDAILDEVVEGTLTMRQVLRIALAALALKSGGGGTPTITFRDLADLKNRITATVDSSNNRTTVTLDGD